MDDAERGDVKTKLFIGNLTDEVTREDVRDVLPSAQIAAVNRLRASTCESIGHDALHHHMGAAQNKGPPPRILGSSRKRLHTPGRRVELEQLQRWLAQHVPGLRDCCEDPKAL